MRSLIFVGLGLVACEDVPIVSSKPPPAPSAATAAPATSAPTLASLETPAMSASASPPPLPPAQDPIEERGRRFVLDLRARKFKELVLEFDATMAGALPPDKLASTWDQLVVAAGTFQQMEASRVVKSGAYQTVVITIKFERARLDAKVAFDREGKVAGLFFAPPEEPYSDPSYVSRAQFEEREVKIGSGEWELPGTLSVPRGTGPFPVVVLVHGSGPNDRDESVGANKPFKDLAGGLASKGIAVLRYDKRTRVHASKLTDTSSFTVDHETVDDAVLAVELMAKIQEIDPKRIVVAGHSLGGQLAPRIGNRSDKVAAIAILAGSTRPVPDMMIEQMTYIAGLDGRKAPEETDQIAKVTEAQKRIRAIQGGAAPKSGEVVLGAGAAYWIDMGKYDALAAAKAFPRPIFVAQGGRDYQVTDVDFGAWKRALAARKDVVLKLYPELNHVFGAGEGKSTPEDYHRRAAVDVRVIEDLAGWVRGL